jgi:hypothetical protein
MALQRTPPPADQVAESVVVALIIEYRQRTGHHRWRERWESYQPAAVELGPALATHRAHAAWVRTAVSAEELFIDVAQRVSPIKGDTDGPAKRSLDLNSQISRLLRLTADLGR